MTSYCDASDRRISVFNLAHFRLRGRKNRRGDSHGPASSAVGNEGAPLDSTANRGPIQGESNTRGHGSFRRLLSSIISPARGRPRVVSPRGASSSSTLTPLAPARGSVVVVRFLSPSSFRVYLIPRTLGSSRRLHGTRYVF